MKKLQITSALLCALTTWGVSAEAPSTATTTRSTTTTEESVGPGSNTRTTVRKVDDAGQVTTRSQTYQGSDPVTGDASSSATTTVESPDGARSTVEKEIRSEGATGNITEIEKRTRTSAKQY